MSTTHEHLPSATDWVRKQVDTVLATGDTAEVSVADRQVVMMATVGVKTGKIRYVPVMRVERDGVYAAVASKGGAPTNPQWVANLNAHPDITLQDGTRTIEVRARLATQQERADWWPLCVQEFPPYADYEAKTDRVIPVYLLEPR